MKKCLGCMKDYQDELAECPFCGYGTAQMEKEQERMPDALSCKTVLFKRYTLGRILSYGDYSILYLAWDALLSKKVVIREFFPVDVTVRGENNLVVVRKPSYLERFQKGKDGFLRDNMLLHHNQDLNGIVHVYRCFEENNTAYAVMEYLEGCTLEDYLYETGEETVRQNADYLFGLIAKVVMEAHQKNLVHLNLNPMNIYVLSHKQVCLIDFGRAKCDYEAKAKGKVLLLNPRYTAPEVYEEKNGGTSCDAYSLGAIYYRMVVGQDPPYKNFKSRRYASFLKSDSKQEKLIARLMEKDVGKRLELSMLTL